MKLLLVNSLVERTDAEGKVMIERVLWIDPHGVDCVLFDLTTDRSLPVRCDLLDLRIELENGVARILEVDGYAAPAVTEADIPEGHRKRRDRAWKVLETLMSHGPKLFDRVERGQLISQAARQHQRSKRMILYDLRRYWRGGQVPNALVPRYKNCGAEGRARKAGEKKRGRPSKLHIAGHQSPGINVDDSMRARIELGVRKFYLKKGRTLKDAYDLTLGEYFRNGVEPDEKTGELRSILPPLEELPTFNQFYYWYRKQFDPIEVRKRREGEQAYQLRHRGLIGNTRNLAERPGALYQIDATLADVYLVSAYNRQRIIGRPVLYLVIDVFSRLIVGFSVSLEGPSWEGIRLAIENAIADKVRFCKEFDLEIEADDWPSRGLPEAIVGDRGEMESARADGLVATLGITVQNTPPYRADYKGLVERHFRLANDRMIKWLPGAVQPKQRGSSDYRLDATLTLKQFRKLLIYNILNHNQTLLNPKTYPVDQEMIQDQVMLKPVRLWNWGMRRRAGALRRASDEQVRAALLPGGQASVTEHGIMFKGHRYTCDLAQQELWFDRARQDGRWIINITYNPRLPDIIYYRDKRGGMVPCRLLDEENPWRGLDWYEYEDFEALQEAARASQAKVQLEQKLDFEKRANAIVEEAEALKLPNGNVSKAGRVRDIRPSRAAERELEQAQRDGAPFSSISQGPVVPALQPPADDGGWADITQARLELIRGQKEPKHE